MTSQLFRRVGESNRIALFALPFGQAFAIVPISELLLTYVTGIPPAERQALARRGAYAAYQKQVSAFIPWPRKKSPQPSLESPMSTANELMSLAGYHPERQGIRRLLQARKKMTYPGDSAYADNLRQQPIAIEQQAANDQHYEVPQSSMKTSVIIIWKYSSAYFDAGSEIQRSRSGYAENQLRTRCLVDGQISTVVAGVL